MIRHRLQVRAERAISLHLLAQAVRHLRRAVVLAVQAVLVVLVPVLQAGLRMALDHQAGLQMGHLRLAVGLRTAPPDLDRLALQGVPMVLVLQDPVDQIARALQALVEVRAAPRRLALMVVPLEEATH